MLCAISGEAPTVPVVSSKSGSVFERRLIEAYIKEHGKDPVTGEELTVDDLIEVKSPRIVRPRPPTLTSIPALLQVFQNEWDSTALEAFTLQQQLAQTRQELSTALYQHDAACRVISRLIKERDEAREALAKVSISGPPAGDADAMQIDGETLPEDLKAKVGETKEKLSKTRKKRPVPEGWADSEAISTFEDVSSSDSIYPGGQSIALDEAADRALVGGADGVAGLYSLSKQELVVALKGEDGPIRDGLFYGESPITAASSGVIKVWNQAGNSVASLSAHGGDLSAISIHPSGDILASVGDDKSWVLYDLNKSEVAARVRGDSEFTSGQFHPDGHLFGAGTINGAIEIYAVDTLSKAAEFNHTSNAPVKSLDFSENGLLLASAQAGENTVTIWNLGKSAMMKVLDVGARVDAVKWDYTGQFLASVGPAGVVVFYYDRKAKSFTEVLRKASPGVAVAWGKNATSLAVLAADGRISVLGTK